MKYLCLLLILFLMAPHHSVHSENAPIPQAMAVLGDSISEGMMTDFSLERPPSLGKVFTLMRKIKSAITSGDSNNEIDYFRYFFARETHSWATGTDNSDYVFSHYERLKKVNPQLVAYNFAVSGSESVEISNQVKKLLKAEQQSGVPIDYVMALFGANDLKAENLEKMVQPKDFGLNMLAGLRQLLDANPYRNVLLVGLPKIHDIMEKSQNFTVYKVLGAKIKCNGVRQRIYGKSVFFDPRDRVNFDGSRMAFEMYRNELEIVAEELRQQYPLARIKTVQNYDAPSLVYKSLSVDCFHPSTLGQALLAEATWVYGFWPELVNESDY